MNSIRKKYCEFLDTQNGVKVYQSFKKYLYGENDSLIQVLNNEVLQNLKMLEKEELHICDIGGGDGRRIKQILNFLSEKFQLRFKLDFIEQSKVLIDNFNTLSIENYCETRKIHKLFEETKLSQQYDIIFLVHSIFALDNGKAIGKILSLRKEDGKIVVLSNSPDSFLARLKCITDENYQDKRYEIDDFRNSLKRFGVKFFTKNSQTKWAIPKKDFANFTSILLEWITLGEYDFYSLDKKKAILEYLECNRTESVSRFFFNEKEEILIIPSFS